MPVLLPDDPVLGANPGADFISPFPSNDSNLSVAFDHLLDLVATLPGAEPGGVLAASQAKAWTSAQSRLMFERVTSEQAGGIRFDWLPKVANIAKSGRVQGLFANVQFAPSTKENKLGKSLAKVGLDVGLSVLTAVPVYGQVLKAAIAVGAFFANLFGKKADVRPLLVPWQEYSRDIDEDIINRVLSPVLANVDWTFPYLPSLDWERGFSMQRTEKGGETRAWGVFGASGELLPGPGLGMMPGTERLTQTIQIALTHRGPTSRTDAITDVGSFLPATSQFLTGSFSMVDKQGNPDMFKFRASEIREAWRNYFDAMWQSFRDAWPKQDHPNDLFLAKMISSFLYGKDEGFPDSYYSRVNLASFGQPWLDPSVLEPGFAPGKEYATVEKIYVRPALRRLMLRQKAALSRSLACALVRPRKVAGLPRYAAFADKGPALSSKFATWGEELTAECEKMREVLLGHAARYGLAQAANGIVLGKLIAPDVRLVDPKFAERLEATLVGGQKLAIEPRQWIIDPDASPGPDAEPPGGGPPFPLPSAETMQRWVYPILAALGVGAGAGTAIWLGEGY